MRNLKEIENRSPIWETEEKARRLTQENELLVEIGRIISSTLEIEEVYERFAEKVKEVIPFDRIAVSTINLGDYTRTIRYTAGNQYFGHRVGYVYPLAGTRAEHLIKTGASLVVNSANIEDVKNKLFPASRLTDIHMGSQSSMLISLISNNAIIGMLSIQSAMKDIYSDKDLQLAERVANQIAGAIANAEIFSELKKAEQETRELLSVLEAMPNCIIVHDAAGHFLYANQKTFDLHGYSREEFMSLNLFKITSPASNKLVDERLRQLMAYGEISFEVEHLKKDGTLLPLLINVKKSLWEGKSVFLSVETDITDRKAAEQAMMESERRLEMVTDNVPAVIGYVDKDYRYRFVNVNYEKWFGLKRDDMLGMTVEALLPRGAYELSRPFIDRALAGEEVTFEGTAQLPDGSTRVFYNHLVPDLSSREGIKGYYVLVSDITELRRAEKEKQVLQERLQRAEKMEALGELAGGVAHDLNNVLGVLMGYSELLVEKLPQSDPLREYAARILKSSEKGAAIIQDLLTLARRGVAVSQVLSLNGIIANCLSTPEFDMLKTNFPSVVFRAELEDKLFNIKGSPVHLEKTVFNLLSNAAEAIAGKGEVLVRTENRYLDRPVQGYDAVQEGEYALLTVSDTGVGIAAADMEKIFEPFYTRKYMGRSGTGLGLAIVWGTVKDHNGYIDVQSAEGRGTSFMLYFPVTRAEMGEEAQKISPERFMGRGESVLVIDDVEEQRQVAATLLNRLGYLVNSVSSGEEAVEYLRNNRADILVLDMIMEPGIDGFETYRRIAEIRPHQKAIIVSGFSETQRIRDAQALGAGTYVKKPYVMEKIGVALREELDKK